MHLDLSSRVQTEDHLVLWDNALNSQANSSSEPVYGSLHDVVGRDGVLMISVENQSSGRLSHALGKLAVAGIQPTLFMATEAKGNSTGNLSGACRHADETDVGSYCGEASGTGRKGDGCRTKIEQAITDSHRRALVRAQDREENWTVIIEDDAVPVVPERFSETFKNAWKNVPDTVKFIRLGWCTFEIDRGPIEYRDYIKADDAKLVSFMHWTNWYDDPPSKMYYVGGCTTGYMVRKDVIPEILGIFPCCSPIDACLAWQFFFAPGKRDEPWDPRGHQVMMSFDIDDSRSLTDGYANFNQSGILAQDNRGFNSTRPEWNSTDA